MKLRKLAVACCIYRKIADDKSFLKLTTTVENSPNLFEKEHIKALLEFLNKFGCRHIAKDSVKRKIASEKIHCWYNEIWKDLKKRYQIRSYGDYLKHVRDYTGFKRSQN